MTPEEKLCSRTWRLRNSAGVLWSILSFGLLTGVGFLIRGLKAKNKLWIWLGVGFSVLGLALLVASTTFDSGTKAAPIHSVASDIWGWCWFLTFAGGVALTFVFNRKWLIWKAHSPDSKWYAQAGSSAAAMSHSNSPVVGFDPNAGAAALSAATLGTSDTTTSTQTSGQQVPNFATAQPLNVNSASVQDLTRLVGIGQDAAQRIVQARQGSGPFSSFEQLMSKSGVPPHLLIPLRDDLVFGPGESDGTGRQEAPGHALSRRLDL